MKPSKKLVFFGNEKLATGISAKRRVLDALVKEGYKITAAITGDIPPDLAAAKPEAAVLVAYGRLIPQEVLDIFPKGIVNIHPSLLPLYRGSTPIETAILDGAAETGVSLMRLTAKMDTGPIYAQKRLALTGTETKQELADKLLDIGRELLAERLPSILEGWDTPKPQIESEATYTKLLKKDDGVMDLAKPAEILEREVRAYAGWPRSRTAIHGREAIITKARVAKDKDDGNLVIKCQPGYLEIEELIAPSGKTMTGEEFLRGYRK
jgi:methionyl-tRNA formyltransferase